MLSGWRKIPAAAVDRYYVALDPGHSVDPSAISVVQHVIKPLELWLPNDKAMFWRQLKTERFFVRHLERLPMRTAYPAQIEYVAGLLARDPLQRATFVIDATGVGLPVAQMFDDAGLRPVKVLITAGNEITRAGPNIWHVAKGRLVSAFEAKMHGELRIATALPDSEVLKKEMKDFARKVAAENGRITYNARSGSHDDLLLSLCIAIFAATNRNTVSITELRI